MAAGRSRALIALVAIVIILIIGVAAYLMLAPGREAERVVVIGTTDKITELDPATSYDFFTWEVLSNVMAGLVKYDPETGEIVGDIAETWTVEEGGKKWIFKLRTDAAFPDGTPCTAKDFVRSIKRVMSIKGDPSWLVTEFVENVEAPDDYTVVITLKKPVSFFLSVLATPPYFIVHPDYPENEAAPDATYGGCGPYKIVDFKRDEYIILEPNPNYHGEKPKNDRVIIRFYKNSEALRIALENGEIDVAWRTLNPDDIEALKGKGFNVIEVPGNFIRYIVVKVDQPPLDSKKIRQALAAAIDREEIAEKVFRGTVEPLYSMVPSTLWSHVPVFKEKYGDGNLELAIKLLREAGITEDNKLKVVLWYTPTHYGDTEAALAALIKEQWERTGLIEVELKSAEWGTYVDLLSQGKMMLNLLGWYPDYLDPDNFLTPFLLSTANTWTGTGYANPRVDQLLNEAQIELDKATRERYYRMVQEILADEVPYIPLIQGKLFVVTSEKVVSIQVSPLQFLIYSSIEVSG